MYKYLEDLDEGCSYAVVNTEGRICVLASEKAGKKFVALRHYAFLLDFMNVPVDDVLFVCVDSASVRKITAKFCRMYGGLPCLVAYIGELGNCCDKYEYVVVCDAHNVDVFTIDWLKELCAKANNLYLYIDCVSIWKNHNIELADLLRKTNFDFEISTDGNYSVAKYLDDVGEELEKLYRKYELEALQAKKEAEREAERKLKAERMAAEKAAKLEAERKEKERLECERRAEAERKRVETEMANRTAEMQGMQQSSLFVKLKPYMDWYFLNWTLLADKGSDRWNAFRMLHESNKVSASNFVQSMRTVDEFLPNNTQRLLENIEACEKYYPDDTALLLRNIFNEKDSVQMRIMLCRNQAMRLSELVCNRSRKVDVEGLTDVEAWVNCLAFAYPSKHYFLCVSHLKKFSKKVEFEFPFASESETRNDFLQREYVNLVHFCDDIRKSLTVNLEMIGMKELDKGGYDARIFDNHLLTADFIYNISTVPVTIHPHTV